MSATFPGGVKSFSTKTDGPGQTIFAAHINDLQDEVVAIETALTAGPLAVAGGSAATPAYGVAGDSDTGMYSSGANALDFATGGVKGLGIDATHFVDSPTQPRCLAYHNTTQSITTATWTALVFNSEDADVGGMHDTVSNTSRITIPVGGDGLYLVIATCLFAANTTGNLRGLRFKKSGSSLLWSASTQPGASGSAVGSGVQATQLMTLAAGDYIEVEAFQDSGGSLNVGSAVDRFLQNQIQAVKLW